MVFLFMNKMKAIYKLKNSIRVIFAASTFLNPPFSGERSIFPFARRGLKEGL
jgi:hypothetical protein